MANVGSTQFMVRSAEHGAAAELLARRYAQDWPMSLGFRAVVANAEHAAAEAGDGGRLDIVVDPGFRSGNTKWHDDGTVIQVPTGRERSTPDELAAGGLTRMETTLLFELHNAASRLEFQMLETEARRGTFERTTLDELPPGLQALVRRPSDIAEMAYAVQVERLEYMNYQRCSRVIGEFPAQAQNSAAVRRLRGIERLDFAGYLDLQIHGEKGHFDRLRRLYRREFPPAGSSGG